MEDRSLLVGYEQPLPWLLGEMAWRYCLECYLPTRGQTATPLTRQMVEVEHQQYGEHGEREPVPHRDWRGSTRIICWVCGKNLLDFQAAQKASD